MKMARSPTILEEGVDLHDVAQHVVDLDVHLLDVFELVAEA